MTLSLPPFTKAVSWLIGINTAVFLLVLLLDTLRVPFGALLRDYFSLIPIQVVQHGWIWQLLTYGVIHFEFWHWFGNMLGLWMFGAAIEQQWGSRRFLELFSLGVFGAALTTVALSYSHLLGNPYRPTIGASGGVFAILIAFGMLFGDNEIMMIPFPFTIKAKYFVGILIVVTLAFAMGGGGNVAYVAHLGGLLFGYLYVRRGPKAALVMLGFRSGTTGCEIPITGGSGGGRRRSLRFICDSMTAMCTLMNTGTIFHPTIRRGRGMGAGSRGG